MKLLVTLFSFTLAFHTLIAGAQENAPLSAPFPTGFVLGDRWEWNVKSDPDQGGYSTKTREVIMSRSRQILMFRVDADSNNPVYFKNEFETNPFFQTKSLTPFREWPLTVGKTWEYSGEFMSGGGVARVNQSAKVVAFEDISVPAGTFRAFKIMYSGVVSEQGRSWG